MFARAEAEGVRSNATPGSGRSTARTGTVDLCLPQQAVRRDDGFHISKSTRRGHCKPRYGSGSQGHVGRGVKRCIQKSMCHVLLDRLLQRGPHHSSQGIAFAIH